MKSVKAPHPWDVSTDQAKAIQEKFRHQVIRVDQLGSVKHVAGIDVGFESNGTITRASVVFMSFPELIIEEQVLSCSPTTFPYVPGLLSFREIPAVLKAFSNLSSFPDLLFCDGQGIAHPRRFGLASHLGLICDTPSIGVAKSRLIGEHEKVGQVRGDWQPLIDLDERVGSVLRTRTGVKPLYVSPGYRVSIETANYMVLECTRKYRLPEPIRHADRLASKK